MIRGLPLIKVYRLPALNQQRYQRLSSELCLGPSPWAEGTATPSSTHPIPSTRLIDYLSFDGLSFSIFRLVLPLARPPDLRLNTYISARLIAFVCRSLPSQVIFALSFNPSFPCRTLPSTRRRYRSYHHHGVSKHGLHRSLDCRSCSSSLPAPMAYSHEEYCDAVDDLLDDTSQYCPYRQQSVHHLSLGALT
jgi:hypothetical protein